MGKIPPCWSFDPKDGVVWAPAPNGDAVDLCHVMPCEAGVDGRPFDPCAVGGLMAAAPDLLAACEAAKQILATHIPPDAFDGHAARALVMVKDAIAKAKPGEARP